MIAHLVCLSCQTYRRVDADDRLVASMASRRTVHHASAPCSSSLCLGKRRRHEVVSRRDCCLPDCQRPGTIRPADANADAYVLCDFHHLYGTAQGEPVGILGQRPESVLRLRDVTITTFPGVFPPAFRKIEGTEL